MALTGRWLACVVMLLGAAPSLSAADYPIPKENDWIVHDFHFATGDVLPELRLHYTTVGNPTGKPVLILHGTVNNGRSILNDQFAGLLFGPGQPLDAQQYFIILPDAIGAGGSSKPSNGLRMQFPKYDYDDIVRAQYRLVTEGLGIRHLRLVMGISAGGMQTWMWGERYPDSMDALVPMASMPMAMSGRNWIMRRMLIDAIRNDPEWDRGNFTKQPPAFQVALTYFGLLGNGGTQALYKAAPTRDAADRYIDRLLAQPTSADANDTLYQYEASRNYDPSPLLERIQAPMLVINSADDEKNPPELGSVERAISRVRHGQYVLIPASEATRGHGTVSNATFWSEHLARFLGQLPRMSQ